MEYIIVQAGGKGTRLKQYTKNKPKAIVPVDNLPILFHLFRKYPDKKFVIIGDYKKDVLEKYLKTFAKVKYLLVDGSDGTGTCAGVKKALKIIPQDKSFMLIWSDLVLPDEFEMPEENGNWIGVSKDFPCRWCYENGEFREERSENQGVAGCFLFENKNVIQDVPDSGEFVRWLQSKGLKFKEVGLYRTKEYGLVETIETPVSGRCRPFNRITMTDEYIIKEGIDKQGKDLAVREKKWYKYCQQFNFDAIPYIYEYEPFKMERINGKNIFEYDFSHDEKRVILKKLVDNLNELHSMEKDQPDYFSIDNAYFSKTMERLNQVRDLIPFADKKEISINGRKCRNVFYYQDELHNLVKNICCESFCFIHGDCTFSNMMLRNGNEPVLIDPRGYFGYTELLGDPLYDWAKLYYSIRGNYDQFNLKRFTLDIEEKEVFLNIESNNWEDMEDEFLSYITEEQRKDIKLIHAIIWLSLTTYAWEDYDSICGAFYNGLYYLEEML